MILNAFKGSILYAISAFIISSLQPIISLNGTTLFKIKSLALPVQTSVPWDNPDILTSSAKVFGFVSRSVLITKLVPNSGTPSVPVSQFISSFLTPSSLHDENKLIVFLSSRGTFSTSIPDKS